MPKPILIGCFDSQLADLWLLESTRKPELILIDEAKLVLPGFDEMVEVLIKMRQEPIEITIKPNNYAGDHWRRQGKRKGNRYA